jgi:hypothetical protein
MDERIDQVLISGGKRYCQPDTLAVYQNRSRRYLEELRRVHPIFGRLAAIGTEGVRPLPDDLAGLEGAIAELAYDPAHPHRYLRTQVDGSLHGESLCRTGFSVSYYSRDAEGRGLISTEEGGAGLMLRGCSATNEPTSDVVIELPMDERMELHTPQMLRRLLRTMLEVWGCTYGRVRPYRYEQTVKDGNAASYAGQWLFYLPLPELGRCLPHGISWEPFHRGILIETTPHLPRAGNPKDVAAGERVRDALDDVGLISHATYAIHGWPPDREEWLYESFISSAPSDRKYTVHCINFDGYDADRNVLLFAKLFRPLRRQPKAWGLRGWDGPVLNEARRQVRAAAKAGGVPIEWHIGLEEPALRVRQLLADYTDITEQQLKVIYTPLEQALRPAQ